jgi:hypothetical protein
MFALNCAAFLLLFLLISAIFDLNAFTKSDCSFRNPFYSTFAKLFNDSCRQGRNQDFAKGGLTRGSGGGAPNRRRLKGVWGRRANFDIFRPKKG